MKFSVIIPVYNAEKHLERAVKSVFAQTYGNYEILLIDDGSTDGSAVLCDSIAQSAENVTVIHRKNSGQLITRCCGIERSNGDYCVFLDSDDELTANCLETLYNAINKYSQPDVIIYSYFQIKNNVKKTFDFPYENGVVYDENNKKDILSNFYKNNSLNTMWTKAVKKNCGYIKSEDVGVYSVLRNAEDRLHSMYCLSEAKTILCLDAPLYMYYVMDDSVSHSYSIATVEKFNTKILINKEKEFLKLWNMYDAEFIQRCEAHFLNHAMYILYRFYANAGSLKNGDSILKYDWTKFVEKECLENLEENQYVSDANKKLWRYVSDRKDTLLKILFLKRKFHKKLKSLKRKIFK